MFGLLLRGQTFNPNGTIVSPGNNNAVTFCASDEMTKRLYKNTPSRQTKMDAINAGINYQSKGGMNSSTSGAIYTIPVVVHIIHNNGPENISDAQVIQGIQDLNDGFANQGPYQDVNGVDVEIVFCMAERDPNGNATNGITRDISPLTDMIMEDDDITLKDINRWNPNDYLNIWLVQSIASLSSGSGVIGYAYFPSSHGQPEDGIVCEAYYFGSTPGNSAVQIHEVGHYLGLYHTFQGGCTNNDCQNEGDRVCDTPPDNSTAFVPCNLPVNTCSTDDDDLSANNPFRPITNGGIGDQNDLVQNHMDYGDIACHTSFTDGQRDRMRTALTISRYSLLQSNGCAPPCNDPMTISFTTSATTVTIGSNVNFNSTSTGNISSYDWSINNATFATTQNASFQFNTVGIFWVVLTLNNADPNCQEKDSVLIRVDCDAQTTFTSSATSIMPGNQITFTNTTIGVTSYQWYIDDIPQVSTPNFTHIFPNVGVFMVYVVSCNNNCCDTSAFQFIRVGLCASGQNLVPNPSFENYGTLPCSWLISQSGFSNAVQNWIMPTGGSSDIFSTLVNTFCFAHCLSTSTSAVGQQLPRTGNVMSAILTYGAGCGSQPDYREYLEIQLTSPLVVGVTYYAEMYISHTDYSKDASNNIGMHFSDTLVNIPAICTELNFTPQINETSIITDSVNWVKISGTFIATSPAEYLILGNFYDNINTSIIFNGSNSSTNARYFVDDVLVEPVCFNVSSDTTICQFDTITLYSNSDLLIGWAIDTLSDIIISTDSIIRVSPLQTTTYLAYSSYGTESITVYVNFPLSFSLGNDTTTCDLVAMQLDAGTGFVDYLWSTANTSQTINVNSEGIYWVEVSDSNGCQSRDTIEIIQANASPPVDLGPDTMVCPGIVIPIDAGVGYVSYKWQDFSDNQLFTAWLPGTYWVEATDSCGNISMDTIKVLTVDTVNLSLGADSELCNGEAISLDAGQDYVTYLWQDGSTAQTYTALDSGTYIVQVSTAEGCAYSDTIRIDLCETSITTGPSFAYLPNVFYTSSNNPENEKLFVFGKNIKSYELAVYDRWGEMVYETNDSSKKLRSDGVCCAYGEGWDGTFRNTGKPLNGAVFVFILKGAFTDGNKFNETGNITLIR